jgi:hypothetical protein
VPHNLHQTIFFLLWAEQQDPKMMYGGHTVAEAIDALADIMGVDATKLRELI